MAKCQDRLHSGYPPIQTRSNSNPEHDVDYRGRVDVELHGLSNITADLNENKEKRESIVDSGISRGDCVSFEAGTDEATVQNETSNNHFVETASQDGEKKEIGIRDNTIDDDVDETATVAVDAAAEKVRRLEKALKDARSDYAAAVKFHQVRQNPKTKNDMENASTSGGIRLSSPMPMNDKMELLPDSGIFIDSTELERLNRLYRLKPNRLACALMRSIIGIDNLKDMTPIGHGKRRKIPQTEYKAVEKYVSQNAEPQLTSSDFQRIMTDLCATVRKG